MVLPCIPSFLTSFSHISIAQKSTFNFGNKGWQCDGDPVSITTNWFSTGGNPGGNINGKPALSGVYIWRLEWDAELFEATKTWRADGDVTVLR